MLHSQTGQAPLPEKQGPKITGGGGGLPGPVSGKWSWHLGEGRGTWRSEVGGERVGRIWGLKTGLIGWEGEAAYLGGNRGC